MQPNKIHWTPAEDSFLRLNFFSMTNKELAEHLGKKLTITRMRCRDLGLKKIKDFVGWTEEQVRYLKNNFRRKGDTILAEQLNEIFNTDKFTRKNVRKKRSLLGLIRKPHEVQKIVKDNYQLTDRYIVVNCLRIEKDLRSIYLKNSQSIIQARKDDVRTKRLLKQKRAGITALL